MQFTTSRPGEKKNSLTVSLSLLENFKHFFVVFVQKKKKKVKTKTTKLKTKKVRNNIRTRTSRLIFYLHCLAIMMCQGKTFRVKHSKRMKNSASISGTVDCISPTRRQDCIRSMQKQETSLQMSTAWV